MGRKGKKEAPHEETIQLNLNPMMDLFAVLIPALLMMSAVVEVTVLNVSAPAIGGSDTPPPTPEKPPLDLTIVINDGGYIVKGAGGVLAGPGANPAPLQPDQVPTIPLVQKGVVCSRFRGTWPPPRSRNKDEKVCVIPTETRNFWVYDLDAATRKAVEVKDAYPEERRVIIQANANIEYESVIDLMDAVRDVREASGSNRTLFDEVVLSPAPAS